MGRISQAVMYGGFTLTLLLGAIHASASTRHRLSKPAILRRRADDSLLYSVSTAAPCPPGDSLCVLMRLRERGLINHQQFQRNKYFLTRQSQRQDNTEAVSRENPGPETRNSLNREAEVETENPIYLETTTTARPSQRNRYNSKYNADCWSNDGSNSERPRGSRGGRGRGRGGRGRGGRVPCLWETGYYLGDQ